MKNISRYLSIPLLLLVGAAWIVSEIFLGLLSPNTPIRNPAAYAAPPSPSWLFVERSENSIRLKRTDSRPFDPAVYWTYLEAVPIEDLDSEDRAELPGSVIDGRYPVIRFVRILPGAVPMSGSIQTSWTMRPRGPLAPGWHYPEVAP